MIGVLKLANGVLVVGVSSCCADATFDRLLWPVNILLNVRRKMLAKPGCKR